MECDDEDEVGDGVFVAAAEDVDDERPAVEVLDGGVDHGLKLGDDGGGLALTQVLAVEFHYRSHVKGIEIRVAKAVYYAAVTIYMNNVLQNRHQAKYWC